MRESKKQNDFKLEVGDLIIFNKNAILNFPRLGYVKLIKNEDDFHFDLNNAIYIDFLSNENAKLVGNRFHSFYRSRILGTNCYIFEKDVKYILDYIDIIKHK